MNFADKLREGETIYTIWSSVGSGTLVNQLAINDFDGIVVDMQHGSHSDDTVVDAIDAIISKNKISITRIPVNRYDAASRALDIGFEAVIAPMINSKEDAEEFVSFMKYPPLGERSWGPTRALFQRGLNGADYLKTANDKTLAFAMIETKEAYDAFDDIISVEGIDGIFVGPSDLSLTFSNGRETNPLLPEMQDAIAQMPKRAKDHGKFAGIFAGTPEIAKTFAALDYQFVNISLDVHLIKAGAHDFKTRAGF